MRGRARAAAAAVAAACFLFGAEGGRGEAPRAYRPGDLFERVLGVLERGYFDRDFRNERLPALAGSIRPAVRDARSLREERELVQALLSRIPTSHLALLSSSASRKLHAELENRDLPTAGFELLERDGGFFVASLLEGGPGERAGLSRWDRILELDGVDVAQSPRVGWRTDDAHLPDPPAHEILVRDGEVLPVVLEHRPGEPIRVTVRVRPYSAFRAARASVRVLERASRRIGYLHLHFMHERGAARLLSDSIKGPFRECDAMVLDLRGRGGSTLTVTSLLSVLTWARRGWGRPVAVVVDRGTRSAKEILAYEIRRQKLGRLVGETTAGAVIPATFEDVGHGMVLMYPSFSLGEYTRRLEGRGVTPDVRVRDSGPYSAGADPILEAALRLLAPPAARREVRLSRRTAPAAAG